MAEKMRYYITPSSLGSYFGVGFNEPDEQFAIDSAQTEAVFDDDSIDRMSLGKYLEDASLNYFEEKLNIKITDRNTEVKWGYDGKIKYVVDGKTEMNGRKMVVENKISNSNSYKFTENLGYLFQCQAYMLVEDVDAVLLCGLHHGKPIYTIVERDEDMIEDIKTMTDFVVSALMGIVPFSDIPTDLIAKYSSRPVLNPIEDITEREIEYFHALADLEAEKRDIESRIKALKALYDDVRTFDSGTYEDEFIRLRVTTATRKGSLDFDALKLDYPDIDYSKYMKPDTSYSITKITKK
jgi:hypothetical protein